MSAPTRVAVLASGAGSNLRALLDAAQDRGFPATVVLVVSNRRECGALDIARDRGVEALSLPVKEYGGDAVARDRAILEALHAARVELVVCAGYDRVLSDDVLTAFPGAILNIHPSLLPAFGGGMNAVEDALAAGVKVTGCTVHLLAAGRRRRRSHRAAGAGAGPRGRRRRRRCARASTSRSGACCPRRWRCGPPDG